MSEFALFVLALCNCDVHNTIWVTEAFSHVDVDWHAALDDMVHFPSVRDDILEVSHVWMFFECTELFRTAGVGDRDVNPERWIGIRVTSNSFSIVVVLFFRTIVSILIH